MKSVELDFYDDDEGASVDLVLPVFDSESVKFINLETNVADEKMKTDIDFIIARQSDFFQKITAEAQTYSKQVYGSVVKDLVLVKIYLSPDDEDDFGFMFSTDLDPEHGIGIKFKGLELKKIGSSEIAFL